MSKKDKKRMNLQMAIASSCNDRACKAQIINTDVSIDTKYSQQILYYDINIKSGDLVIVDTKSKPAKVVFRLPYEIEKIDEKKIVCKDDRIIDLERVRTDFFPRIAAMYERVGKMKAADDPKIDYKNLVRKGYNRISEYYTDNYRGDAPPDLQLLTDRLEDGFRILDIGCGGGIPIAKTLSQRWSVTGVDISEEQILRARQNVVDGEFICADIMSVDLPAESFNGVVAFYSIFHLPKEEHSELFRRIQYWLKPHGYLLCSLAHRNEKPYTDDYYGVEMYWSNLGMDEYRKILADTGFRILEEAEIGHGCKIEIKEERHPVVFAQKI